MQEHYILPEFVNLEKRVRYTLFQVSYKMESHFSAEMPESGFFKAAVQTPSDFAVFCWFLQILRSFSDMLLL